MLTEQVVEVPEHAPDQPPNTLPVVAAAVSATLWPAVKEAEHVLPQLIPDGLLVTVPLPVLVTVNAYVVWEVRPKVAVILLAASMVTLQVPVPLHPPPLQPVNVLPDPGAAVKLTTAPALYDSEQSEGHEIPASDVLETVPLPSPAAVTESWYVPAPAELKLAETDLSASIVTLQVLVPVQAPDQPAKV